MIMRKQTYSIHSLGQYLPKMMIICLNLNMGLAAQFVTLQLRHKRSSLLQSLNIHVSKSTSPDEFHPRFLQETAETIALPVTLI